MDIGIMISIAGLVVGIIGLFMVGKSLVIKITQKNKHGNNTISNTTIGYEINKKSK